MRRLLLPGGEDRSVVYFGDLKICPDARGGQTLPRLAQAVVAWVQTQAEAAFGVVMDGTPVTPGCYTGRLGIPLFQELGKVAVLRVPTASPGGFPAERSETEPLWLMVPDGAACGRLEDTRRAKRLIADDGVEMQSAHLSCFAYREPRAGVELLQAALRGAAGRGFPALFVAVAAPEAEVFCRALGNADIVVAPATVFGAGLAPAPLWNINTAEI
jgi:hypothetical protein